MGIPSVTVGRRRFLTVATVCAGAVALPRSWFTASAAAGLTLVSNGVAQATIIVPDQPNANETLASQELQQHLARMSGATLAIVPASKAGTVTTSKIYIGSAAPDPGLDKITAGGNEPGALRLHADEKAIKLVGLGDIVAINAGSGQLDLRGLGALYATYALLEQLGVRWVLPSDLGTIVPQASTVTVIPTDRIEHPSWPARGLLGSDNYVPIGAPPAGADLKEGVPWARRNRLVNSFTLAGAQGMPQLPPASPSTNPELFMTENGRVTGQLDVTNPEVLRRAIAAARQLIEKTPGIRYVHFSPPDGLGYGTTPWDGTLIDPFFINKVSLTDRYVRFYNMVLDDLQKDYPDIGLATYAYTLTMLPPVQVKPNPKILAVIAPITVDRIHAIGNPLGWERNFLKKIIEGWRAAGAQVAYYGYTYNLADPGMPFSATRQLAVELPYFKRAGMTDVIQLETLPRWGYDGPALYLGARLLWNANEQTSSEILGEYSQLSFGPAADAMQEHFAVLANAFEQADYSTGNVFDFPHILTTPVLAEMEQALTTAERLAARAGDPSYAKRVALVRLDFQMGRTMLAAHNALLSFDFLGAKSLYDRATDLATQASENHPIGITPIQKWYLSVIYLGPNIEAAYTRVTGGNTMIAQLPDTWATLLDPHDEGETDGLWQVDVDDRRWIRLHTRTQTWSDQGLRYYRGKAWYRTTMRIPPRYSGRPIRLWLGIVEQVARVWINGTEVPGINNPGAGASLSPFEFDVTNAIRLGQDNQVTVQVDHVDLTELGTGGLMGPAFFWAAPAGSPPVETQAVPAPVPLRPPQPAPVQPVLPPRPQRILARLPDEWLAMLAPEPWGDGLELWQPGIGTQQWLGLKTATSTLQQQGLGYYTDELVYRTTAQVPTRPRGAKKVRLWLSRIDRTAQAWLNGTKLQLITNGGSDVPWEFDATPAVRYAHRNIVVVIVDNVNTTSPGGLSGPSYLTWGI